METLLNKLLNKLRKIPDFPKSGILFYDVTSWIADPACMSVLRILEYQNVPDYITKVIAIDARGFIIGTQIAQTLHLPMFLARKPGKLPVETDSQSYDLEYGSNIITLEKGIINEKDYVLIVDDLLATGGTIGAVADIVKNYNPRSIDALVWIELVSEGLNGREYLENKSVSVSSLFRI